MVEHLSPASAVSHAPTDVPRGDKVTLLFRRVTEHRPQLLVYARWTRPLRSAFPANCRRFGLQESLVRFSCDGLLLPSQLGLGLVDGDVIEVEEVFDEEEEDEDIDEIDGTRSRFPAGFLPVRMCRWYPSGNCRQGWWGCMFAHSTSELQTP